MFRANTTRRNTKRTMSPIRPATDVSGVAMFSAPVDPATNTATASAATGAGAGAAAAAAVEPLLEKRFSNFFEAETANVLASKPWLRLERGMRLQKIRHFAEAYPGLSTDEKAQLNAFLVKANDAKQLNTKAQITYESGAIQSIKGLKIIKTGDPSVPAVYKIEAGRQTKRNVATE
jgi:hypothetical protein